MLQKNEQQKLYKLPKDYLIVEIMRLNRKVEILKKENNDLLKLLVDTELKRK